MLRPSAMRSPLAQNRLSELCNGSARLAFLRPILDVLAVYGRARAAAQYYAELRPLSDQALAQQGLQRADVPRAVLALLTAQA
jgi:hypothetical protein